MTRFQRWRARIERSPFFFLLAALLLQMVLVPWLGLDPKKSFGFDVVYSLVLASGVWAASGSRLGLGIGIAFGAPALGLRWAVHIEPALEAVSLVAALLFVSFVAWQLLRAAARAQTVSADTVCAAVCVYLLAGLDWAYAYALAQVGDPNALLANAGLLSVRDLFYFSFITLTTLGYGDIVPVSPVARMLASLEAAFGQLFVAVFVARLVGLYTRHDPRA